MNRKEGGISTGQQLAVDLALQLHCPATNCPALHGSIISQVTAVQQFSSLQTLVSVQSGVAAWVVLINLHQRSKTPRQDYYRGPLFRSLRPYSVLYVWRIVLYCTVQQRKDRRSRNASTQAHTHLATHIHTSCRDSEAYLNRHT